jgi:hypothetical protein
MHTILLLTVSNIFMTMLPGAGKSNRTLSIQRRPIENDSRSAYPSRVLRVLETVPPRTAEMELPGLIWPDGVNGLSHLQGVLCHDVVKERVG